MKKILLSMPLLILQAPIAFAQTAGTGDTVTTTTLLVGSIRPAVGDQNGHVATVPEISALEGTAALAVVAAVLLLTWERRRRAR